ncbi:MAG: hypothetical protein RLN78_12090 [Phycisphaerales bacterium]
MNCFLGTALLIASSVCNAGITGLVDHRSVNVSYLYYNSSHTIEGGYAEVSDDAGALFDGEYYDTQSDAELGLFIDTALIYSSSISASGFSSSSYANSYSIEPDVGFTFVTMGFSNQVVFDLDETTTFSVDAEFLSAGGGDGGVVEFERIVDGESTVVYSVQSLNSIMSVHDFVTLEAGTYRYSAINWLGIDTIGRDSDVGISSLTAQVAVVPSPGGSLVALGCVFVATRRRR